MTRRILLVGDPHAHPRYDNDRFEAIGAFARQREVDRVHCVGDWTDYPSLNLHKSMLDARQGNYEDDVEAGNDALARFDEGLDGHPCIKTITLGNHDEYPEQYVAKVDPTLAGTLRWDRVRFRDHGWRVTRFKDTTSVAGIRATHYFARRGTGRAIAGQHQAHAINGTTDQSTVVGHAHVFDHKIKTFESGRSIHSFVAGCNVHPKYREGWCADTVQYWHRGLLLVTMGRGPSVESFEWVTLEAATREVGK